MVKTLTAALVLILLGAPCAAAAESCDFEVRGPDGMTPAVDEAVACVAARFKSFEALYGSSALANTLRAEYERYGIPVVPRDVSASLAGPAAATQKNFMASLEVLREARGLAGSIVGGEERAAYSRYLDAALRGWSEAMDWLIEDAWPQLVTLKARAAWHEGRRGAPQAGRESLDQDHQSCVNGLNAAAASLANRIEVAVLVSVPEPFTTPRRMPVLPRAVADPPKPTPACAISADAGTARRWDGGSRLGAGE